MKTELRTLMNVGPAVEKYLLDLRVRSIDTLGKRDAEDLFRKLHRRIGAKADPCLRDTFSAIIHEAKTGKKTPWFRWTEKRKKREAAGLLKLPGSAARG